MIDTMFKIKLRFQIKPIISGMMFEKFVDKGLTIYNIHGKPRYVDQGKTKSKKKGENCTNI